MPVICREPMEVFQAEVRRTFEDSMGAYLRDFRPPTHRALGDAASRSAVQPESAHHVGRKLLVARIRKGRAGLDAVL